MMNTPGGTGRLGKTISPGFPSPPGRIIGPAIISKEQARYQQTLKYENDAKIFAVKQNEKEMKKKIKKWEKYDHVKIGQRLSPSSNFDSKDIVRERQQIINDAKIKSACDLEMIQENERLAREQRKKEEKWKKYAFVECGQRLDEQQQPAEEYNVSEDHQQAMINNLEQKLNELNLKADFNRTVEEKSENKSSLSETAQLPGPSNNDLNRLSSDEDKENQFQKQMQLAREKMQKQYDVTTKKIDGVQEC